MTHFEYIVTNANGEEVRGELDSADKDALALGLRAQGLFLVWSREKPSAPPGADISSGARPIFSSLVQLVGMLTRRRPPPSGTAVPAGRRAGLFSDRRVLGAAAIVAVLWIAFRPQKVDRETEQARNLLVTVFATGTTRAVVEARFRERQPGVQVSTMTHYMESPGMIYDVPYDDTGGPWNPGNRINGLVTIRRSRFASAGAR